MNNKNSSNLPHELKDFKRLSIDAKTQDKVVEVFGLNHPSEAMEIGVLVLNTFAQAKEQGCDMMYFRRTNEKGEHQCIKFDFIKLIDYIKSKPNDEVTHSVKINFFQ